jgi:nicotinate phosphoribosyltransferase
MMRAFDVSEENYALLTDLYELTMSAAYWSNQISTPATFELYFRRLPVRRSFVLAAGLEQALYYLTHLRFSKGQIHWLQKQEAFRNIDTGFFEFLGDFQFSGEVWAIPEGTPVFPLEPLIQIRAPIIEAQVVETYLLAMLNMQSMVATKSARIVRAAQGRSVIDFGTRRAHGPEAGLLAARASYIGGCVGTSNVLAGYIGNIPTFGTAAHSFTMAFASELEAFFAYHRVFPEDTILLIDTYDVVEAARKVKHVPNVKAVRIDSGDLLDVSQKIREILDEDDLHSVKIIASGDLNEYKIQELLARGAPIDMFGVGTELVTSYDDPAMSGVYKLVQTTIQGKEIFAFKTSPGKLSFPGRKQVYRFLHRGYYSHDEICLFEESARTSGQPLLGKYMENGKQIKELPEIDEIRKLAQQQMGKLSEPYHQISAVEDYPVILSQQLKKAMEVEEGQGS